MIVDQKVNKQYSGVYLIDGCVDGPQLATTSKPNGFKRFVTKLVVGWVWVSIEKLKIKQEELKLLKVELKSYQEG